MKRRTSPRQAISQLIPITLALLLITAGCGPASESGGDPGGASADPGSGYPMTLETPYGTTTLTERPERVAVVDYSSADVLLALDITPVAAP